MKKFLIILQLNNREDSYLNLIKYLKTATTWARPAPGVWFIKGTATSASIRDGIKTKIGSTDKVLVIEIEKQGWATSNVSKNITDWMKENL